MTKHSKIGASSAKRWMACPGSVRLCDGLPSTTSDYAAEGTAAHALAERCLREKRTPCDYLHQTIEGFEVDEDMAEAVAVYVTYVNTLALDSELEIECRFSINSLHKGLYGTADAVLYNEKEKALHVIDYKHGAGVAVEIENNPQLLYYALGAAMAKHNRGFSKVKLSVVQPRCPHEDGTIRTWEFDAVELLGWASELIEAVRRTEEPNAPLALGEHCRWCPAAGICPKLQETAIETAKQDFAEGVRYDPAKLSDTLELLPTIEAWAKAVREFAYAEAERGHCPPGWKLVPKRATRKWRDEEEATEYLRKYGMDDSDIYTSKIRTPAQIEKILGKAKDDIADLVVAESSGHTLAPLSDRRQPIRADAAADFS